MKLLAIFAVVFLAVAGLPHAATAQTQGFEVNVTVRAHSGVVSGSPGDNFLSFSGPIAIPGVGLPPGTYIFRFVAPSIMQVLTEDRSAVYAMFFVTQTWRPEATNKYTVTLRTIVDDAPPRVTAVFLPDSRTGYELPYPKTARPAGLIAMR